MEEEIKRRMEELAEDLDELPMAESYAERAKEDYEWAKEEAKGSEMILGSIVKIKEATRTHLHAVEKLDAVVRLLTEQSEKLHREIERFTVS